MHEHNRPKKRQLKMEPAYDEHSQFERLIAAIARIEQGLRDIQETLESVIVASTIGDKSVSVRRVE